MRRIVLAILLSFVATPLVAQQPAAAGELADRILVVVGDSIILKSDVDLEILQLKQAGRLTDSAKTFKEIVDRRVGELVLLQAAVRDTSLKVTDEQINAEVQRELESRRRQFGSETQFQQALAQAGMTIDELRRSISQDIGGRVLLREFIQKASRDRHAPPVTDADIRKYYNENKATFGVRPATITFNQVVLAPHASDTARASARAKAEEALGKLRNGADWETVVKEYSDDPSTRDKGGDLGWFRSGAMVREFDQVAFAMRPGQISNIVETVFGFHIIKLEKTRGAEREAKHILIIPTLTPEDGERLRARAEEVAQLVRNGANMDSLQQAIGDPNEQSRIGPFPKDRLPAPYNTALADATTGSIIGPLDLGGVNGASKFAIIKVTDTRPSGEFTLDDPQFREQLRETLQQNTMVDELIADWKKRTLVDYRLEP